MRTKKSLGQYMVVNRALLKRIAEYAELNENDIVLEVGCGTGNLTEFLLERSRVIGVEKDRRFVRFLKKRFSLEMEGGKFKLIAGDALKIDFPRFTKFVSNIPFKISSPLTFKLLKHQFDIAVVMYQREFAERLCGEDSRIGVVSKAFCTAEILEIVKPSAFRPFPPVETAVVRITPKPEIKIRNIELFRDFVTFAFTMKRKKIGKIIEEWNKRKKVKLEIDDEIAVKRPEDIGAAVFAEIVDSVKGGHPKKRKSQKS